MLQLVDVPTLSLQFTTWPMITESQMWAIILACVMMVLDVVSGFIGAMIRGAVDSSTMRRGLGHKLLMMVLIATSYILGVGLEHISNHIVNVPSTETVCIYIVVMEIASVIENVGAAWPDFTKSKLYQLFKDIVGGVENAD